MEKQIDADGFEFGCRIQVQADSIPQGDLLKILYIAHHAVKAIFIAVFFGSLPVGKKPRAENPQTPLAV